MIELPDGMVLINDVPKHSGILALGLRQKYSVATNKPIGEHSFGEDYDYVFATKPTIYDQSNGTLFAPSYQEDVEKFYQRGNCTFHYMFNEDIFDVSDLVYCIKVRIGYIRGWYAGIRNLLP